MRYQQQGGTGACQETAVTGQRFATEREAQRAAARATTPLTGADGNEWGWGVNRTLDGQYEVTVSVSDGSTNDNSSSMRELFSQMSDPAADGHVHPA